jgi:hypothetical protein
MSKWIKDLNIRPKSLKLLVEDIGETLPDIGIDGNLLIRTLITQEVILRIDK